MTKAMDEMLKKKYPAKAHAQRVTEYIKSKNGGAAEGVIYLESQKAHMNEDNDQEAPFRQRRYFYYLSGCELPGSYVIYDISKGESTLFIPSIDPDEVVWSGLPLSPQEALEKYDVDNVRLSIDVNTFLAGSATSKSTVYAIDKQVSDHVTFLSFEEKDMTLLKEAIEECRVIKDAYEVALIRKANEVSAKAHVAVMKAVRTAQNECELEALFLQQCIANGCRHQAYSSIVATGTSAATLHYVRNDAPITQNQQNLLLDAGGELSCYAADITRTFPIKGRFTEESKAVYSLVLDMQKQCMGMLKEGVLWDDVHVHAHKVAIRGLLDLGILRGDPDEILKARTSVAFLPHGLGHYLGMDTHDCGGHPNYADPDPIYRYLRVRGHLPSGSVITVEPGIYFCKFIIDPFLENPDQAKFFDKSVLNRYWDVGGVRIEDNVLITKQGIDNLTTVPKEIAEMEALIDGV